MNYDLDPSYAGTDAASADGKHAQLLDTVVAPFFRRSEFVDGKLKGAHGVALNYRLFPQRGEATGDDRGAVVFVTGWGEAFVKYAQLIFELYEAGFSVYTYDHRSQGSSGRPGNLPHPTQLSHVDNFGEYVRDFIAFVDTVVLPRRPHGNGGEGVRVVAHSMGGLVSLLAATERPDLVAKLALTAPMIEPRVIGLPMRVVRLLGHLGWLVGKWRDFAPGKKPCGPELPPCGPDQACTSDETRLSHWVGLRTRFPGCVVGGPSFGWLDASAAASLAFQDAMGEVVRQPVLVVCADDERFVNNAVIERFVAASPSPGRRRLLRAPSGTKHEVLQERDAVRKPIVAAITRFLLKKEGGDDGAGGAAAAAARPRRVDMRFLATMWPLLAKLLACGWLARWLLPLAMRFVARMF